MPQDPAHATEAPAPTDDDCEIRWDQPADEVLALIRAASPEPGAFTAVGDDSVVILDAEVDAAARGDPDPRRVCA